MEIDKLVEFGAQIISDDICEHFRIKKILIIISTDLGRVKGRYYYDDVVNGNEIIELQAESNQQFLDVETLLHELAHHLRRARHEISLQEYSQIEPELDVREGIILNFSNTKGNEKKWYVSTGKKIARYLKVGTDHDELFYECKRDIDEFCRLNLWSDYISREIAEFRKRRYEEENNNDRETIF